MCAELALLFSCCGQGGRTLSTLARLQGSSLGSTRGPRARHTHTCSNTAGSDHNPERGPHCRHSSGALGTPAREADRLKGSEACLAAQPLLSCPFCTVDGPPPPGATQKTSECG